MALRRSHDHRKIEVENQGKVVRSISLAKFKKLPLDGNSFHVLKLK